MQPAAVRSAATILPVGGSAASVVSARLTSGRVRAAPLARSPEPSSSRTLVTVTKVASRATAAQCRSCGRPTQNLSPSSARAFSTSSSSSASAKDPYATLGVKKDAAAKDIKRAYYDLAKKFHPDTNKEKGAKERFVEIQSAYDILSDDKKRAAYDQYGTTDGQPGFDPFGGGGSSPFGAGGFGGFQDFGGFSNAGNAGSIFESLFGAFGGNRANQRGPGFGGAGFAGEARGDDLEATVSISFEEACKGTKRKVVTNPVENCGTCSGSGMKAGAKKSTCSTCNGTGTRTFVIQSGFQMAATCPSCGGAGATVAPGDGCKSCEGLGRVRGRKEVEIDLPAGVDDGFRIRKDGFGDVPLSGAGVPGSLYVRIRVAPSKIWRRQGSTLFFPAHIPFHTAILGGKVRVPTLDGPVEVRVPAGTQVGEEMILQGRGVPSPTRRGQKGDLMVQFDVTMPRSLTRRQREILQQYADEVEGRASKPTTPPRPPADEASSHKPSATPTQAHTQPGAGASTSNQGQSSEASRPKANNGPDSTGQQHSQTPTAETEEAAETATGATPVEPKGDGPENASRST